jgi:NADH-quinone oxidoreductase subunit C
MTAEEIHGQFAAKFGERLGPLEPAKMDAWALVKSPDDLVEIMQFAKRELGFDCLINLSAIDWPKRNQIDVVYHLYSYSRRHAFVLKVQLPREKPSVPSLESVWKSADWLEREQYDLLGVEFRGHPDLRRIMLPDDWIGHPLRRDYKEQASWHGISTTRESPLDGFVRLDELVKKKAAEAPAALAGAPVAKKEVLQ